MRWSPARLAVAAVLTSWAGVFWFLLLTGRSSLYLSPRTDWVVPVGAIVLSIGALGRLASARASEPRSPGARESWGLAVIALPVVAVLAFPDASLGSFAAARRSSFSAANFSADPTALAAGEITLVDLAGAQQSQEGMRALRSRAGTEVDFVGFVARKEGTPADEFLLTRFIVACCVADALSVQVRIVGVTPGRFATDDWVRVTGTMYPLGGEVVVQASNVQKVERPKDPYLTP